MAQKFVDDTIAGSKVVVFSKSNCPHSAKAKQILTKANAPFTVIELDERSKCLTVRGSRPSLGPRGSGSPLFSFRGSLFYPFEDPATDNNNIIIIIIAWLL